MPFGIVPATLPLGALFIVLTGATASAEPPADSVGPVRRLVDEIRSAPERGQKEAAIANLKTLGGAALPGIRELFTHSNKYARLDGVRAVEAMGPAATPLVQDFLPLLEDEDILVRSEAARVVGFVGEGAGAAVPRLVELLALNGTPLDYSIRTSALVSLGRIGAPAKPAVPSILRMIEDHWSKYRRPRARIPLLNCG